ncbi:Glutamate--glyoxylate aminotransferase 2 [Vanrija pseudolonga]|uniref:Glutamate pyruvate transaminase n=1 Tax=Vanrija pseudolonga TaxID=143232 RepID=A0AAF0XZT2_9TREE|nr:Glutamate--glyoxylate aminotransferase 2 [Vanrija pseudolonga]
MRPFLRTLPRQLNQVRTMAASASTRKPVLSLESINPAVLDVHYAVRGELALKAVAYEEQLHDPVKAKELPFDKVVTANIGNPQQKGLNQRPITFWRQVISLLENPALFQDHLDVISKIYPADVIARAKTLYGEIGSVGAYTHSKGIPAIRKKVAAFIEKRDGHPANPEHIFLTAGASAGVSQILGLVLKPGEGCMIPIPQYPLYTATLAYIHAKPVPYYLDEATGWSTSTEGLIQGVNKAKADGIKVKALAIINPGNPTGGVLSRESMEKVVQLCYDEGIVLLADEVYQRNIFDPKDRPFISFKEVVRSMPKEVANSVELVSFHSISKGVSGECGRRGGYFELTNIAEDVVEQIYKMASVTLCPPVTGQVGVDLLVDPPKPGDASYDQWLAETTLTHDNLRDRSKLMSERFNQLPNMSCQPADGAMYLFPQIKIPERAIEEAKKRGKAPDVMYTLDLLDATGICSVAGSGFGQEAGTYHLRVTALCPGVEDYVGKIEKFHKEWIAKWA